MQSAIENVPNITRTAASSCSHTPGFFNWGNAVLAAVLLVGTGGVAPTINYVPPTGPTVARVLQVSDGDADSDRLIDTQEKMAGIRRYLSMKVTDMAKALRVGRPTVYSWLRDEPNLRAEHLQRVEAMYRIARKWRIMSSKPVGAFLNQPLTSGGTLLAILSAKALDEAAIQSAFTQIQEAIGHVARRPSVVEVAKQHGFKLATTQQAANWSSNEDIDM